MQLQQLLYSQGFGTRRVCAGLVQQGLVRVSEENRPQVLVECADPAMELEAQGRVFEVMGQRWQYQRQAYLMLHKPAGTECSQKPSHHPSVYTLLPAPLRQRPAAGAVAGVQAVGRLDQDTTGLLLLSDDGRFIHRMGSPKTQLPKRYQITLKHPAAPAQLERLLAGVVLDDAPTPVRAAACEIGADERQLLLTLTQGKYHQVKRMIAAVGNRVDALHRSAIGGLLLPPELAPGQWRWLTAAELALLGFTPP